MDVVDRNEVGTICSGEWLNHTFTFCNNTDSELRIGEDADIIVGCGCTWLTPTSRVLKPGEQTDVTILIDTKGMAGSLSYRGTIRWSGAKEPITHTMIVHGNAEALLTIDPPILKFAPGDGQKSVTLTGNHFVTLQNWKATTSGEAIGTTNLEVIDERTARITVTPNADPSQFEVVTGTVSVTADIASSERKLPFNDAGLSFSVQKVQSVELSIQPTELLIKIDPETNIGTAALLLRGKELEQKTLAIEYGEHEVTWTLTAPSGASGFLRLTIHKRVDRPLPKALTITVDEASFTVPLIVQP